MTLGAKSNALIRGRVTPSFQDVKDVAPLVLRHRIIPNFNAEADGIGVEEIISKILEHVQAPK